MRLRRPEQRERNGTCGLANANAAWEGGEPLVASMGKCKGCRIPLAVHQVVCPFGSHVDKDVQAVGFEPTRSYLQWILSPPP